MWDRIGRDGEAGYGFINEDVLSAYHMKLCMIYTSESQ